MKTLIICLISSCCCGTLWTQATDNTSINMNNSSDKMSMDNSKLENPMNIPGQSGWMALPPRMDYVPDDVVAKLGSEFGNNLYSITTVKRTDTDDEYMVRMDQNGQMQSEDVDANGNVLTAQ